MWNEFLIPKENQFKWSDLDGKNMEIHVGYDNDYVSVVGKDEDGKMYVIYSGESHENDELRCKYCGSTHAVYWKTQVCIDCVLAHEHDK